MRRRFDAPPGRRRRRHARPAGRRPPRSLIGGVAAISAVVFAAVVIGSVASRPVASPAALDLGLARASSGAPERTVVGTTPPPSASDPADPLQSVAPSVAPSAGNDGGGPSSNQPFAGGVLVADRANHRIVVVDNQGSIVWRFPAADSLPRGWPSVSADDAFIAPDGRSIVANDETHETIVRIDIATRRVVWTYGRYGHAGRGPGELHTPDDAYPLANGDIVVADIENCRVLQIAPDRSIVHQWGRTGVCTDHPPTTFARPNGDTPLPDGGLLITEIAGSRVVRLAPDGHVVFDVHVPVAYPSDAQLDASGNVVVADYSPIGQVVAVDPRTGRLRWRWRFTSGVRRLDHPSLATPLDHGLVSVNDDFRQRLIVIDPSTMRIVWQYGRTDRAGRGRGMLSTPDGHQPIPAGVPF